MKLFINLGIYFIEKESFKKYFMKIYKGEELRNEELLTWFYKQTFNSKNQDMSKQGVNRQLKVVESKECFISEVCKINTEILNKNFTKKQDLRKKALKEIHLKILMLN
ncbi:hypothetical protein A0H76_1652 [Hepatospora eriocheir]|uniref:Uncharacterized protein n=1 Tax=Hepatospora eriocheir TaxID=1081669 RepID=A0A1X0QH18_9MICR|nr:hypothetical protein A0H76_1652 [Hepatospora eriocheir]